MSGINEPARPTTRAALAISEWVGAMETALRHTKKSLKRRSLRELCRERRGLQDVETALEWAIETYRDQAPTSGGAANGSATPDAEYEVICGDECVASASGPKEDAWLEAMQYAQQYQADGKIEIWEVTRRKVWPNDQTLPTEGAAKKP